MIGNILFWGAVLLFFAYFAYAIYVWPQGDDDEDECECTACFDGALEDDGDTYL